MYLFPLSHSCESTDPKPSPSAQVVGWAVLPIMDYTERLRPKGIPFQAGGIYKGEGFQEPNV